MKSTAHVCAHRGCFRSGRHAVGWGLSTGTVQWFCAPHFVGGLVRLAGLLRCMGAVG